MVKVQTGGKLYIAGEYAILYPGQVAILKNIPIYMTALATFADNYSLYSDMFNYTASLQPDKQYSLIQETILLMEEWLINFGKNIKPIHLEITGKLERYGLKFGIGSSGSVVVLTIKAMAALYEIEMPSDWLFKLSAYVLLKRGDNGSMGDIACIAYEHLISYSAFDRRAVSKMIETKPLEQVLEAEWGYRITKIQASLEMDFLVGWTMQPSISKEMINIVKSTITQRFLDDTNYQVVQLLSAFKEGDKEAIKRCLEEISLLLFNLHPSIYTDKLQKLKEASKGLDIVTKSSGSGGGDCGIAISFNKNDNQTLIKRWESAGIELLSKETLS